MEWTSEPHPRNTYWEMWVYPMFDLKDATGVMMELDDPGDFRTHFVREPAFLRHHPALVLNADFRGSAWITPWAARRAGGPAPRGSAGRA
ncbi:ribulose bisphosphate carboxylase small subunit, partial [Paracoccus sp. APAP_BH8]|uniref:ribulose bisphosphate carboxylase small subunit n=1 Tax=Paracoccus sp. APAP_BH8 TaxID=3110237 RepID=UPI002FD818E7